MTACYRKSDKPSVSMKPCPGLFPMENGKNGGPVGIQGFGFSEGWLLKWLIAFCAALRDHLKP
ncbi:MULTISPECIES: hypothetical protein [unclassified Polaromonas]|jgi:hypothetical protein|uniref:hypothetical protein n=1 Tax=unclassified Polaromonas TaxID=2638319 RepID=UPI0025DBA0B0|nr:MULTISPECIES: hypothetical protein [unclassified Polaromonas]HQR97454.1 hypothetical protein [Polaromonas sp.]HQS38677.1 hypothetical protein [Polaromonas sp.]HQT05711.1 hypothetical protein [Polaromonas sp.]